MIQKIKGRKFIYGALFSGMMLTGNIVNVNADPTRLEIEASQTEMEDVETELTDLEEDVEDETAFGDALPNTYSLDAGDPVGEGV